jgi:16S rRNA C967 or C1407 C5-methylase (RsmB/RsmF family)
MIDHDHGCCSGTGSCGRCVRGLLCNRCNLMLGFANDQPEILRAALEYLAGAARMS